VWAWAYANERKVDSKMISIFDFSLIYWTVIFTGLFFILSFLGCYCNKKYKHLIFERIRRYHKLFIYLTLIFFIMHAFLAIISKFGIVV